MNDCFGEAATPFFMVRSWSGLGRFCRPCMKGGNRTFAAVCIEVRCADFAADRNHCRALASGAVLLFIAILLAAMQKHIRFGTLLKTIQRYSFWPIIAHQAGGTRQLAFSLFVCSITCWQNISSNKFPKSPLFSKMMRANFSESPWASSASAHRRSAMESTISWPSALRFWIQTIHAAIP